MMKRSFRLLSTGLLVTTLLAGSGVLAADVQMSEVSASTPIVATQTGGSAAATNDTELSLADMLTYAIQDEYMAQAEYAAIMESFGVQRPYSNIIKAEATHIELLLPLFETYNVSLPVNDAKDHVSIPATIAETYPIGVTAEVNNIKMYESFLQQDLPEDVAQVFEYLKNASENHQAAFERSANGTTGMGQGKTTTNGKGRNQSSTTTQSQGGRGQGNGGQGQGNRGNGNADGTGICVL